VIISSKTYIIKLDSNTSYHRVEIPKKSIKKDKYRGVYVFIDLDTEEEIAEFTRKNEYEIEEESSKLDDK
jgi:hypothetical protein